MAVNKLDELLKVTPNFMVDDVNRTVDWYHDVLDFQLALSVPQQGQFDFAIVKREQVELMFQATSSLVQDLPFLTGATVGASVTFHIEVIGIDELYKKIKDEATIVKDLHTTFYGAKEFYFLDCNGYILTYAESAQ